MICEICHGEGLVKNLICGKCLGIGKIMEEETVVTEEVVEEKESFLEESGEELAPASGTE